MLLLHRSHLSHLSAGVTPTRRCHAYPEVSRLPGGVTPARRCHACPQVSRLPAGVTPARRCHACPQVSRLPGGVIPTRRCHTSPSKALQPALHADGSTDTILYLNVFCFLERLDLKQMQEMTAATQAPATEANRTARATINPRKVLSLVLGCAGVCEGASVAVFDSALGQVYVH